MARFVHKVSGVRVSVADHKALGAEWEPEGITPAPAPKRGRKKADTESE